MRKLNYPLLTALLSALLLLLFTVQDVDAQTNCQVEPCAPLTAGHGPDPCLAKLYCSNSGSVPNGLVACTPAADTDGCGIDASINALPGTDLDTYLKSELPNNCYATGNRVQWLKYWLPLGVNSVKIQGVGSSLKAWAVFHVPGDYTVGSYGANSTPCATTDLVYYDACSNMNQWLTITNPASDPFDENMYLIALIYTAPTNGTINFKTKDCEAICYPYIDCPNDATFECDDQAGIQGWLASFTTITCSFSNTFVTNNYSPSLFTGCNGTGTAAITFKLWRPQGSKNILLAECTANLTIEDTTPPVITCPTVVSPIECPAMPNFGMATAADNCGTPTITHTTSTTPGCGETYSQTRTWTATDACGNTAQCSRTINVVDTKPPVITCPTVVSPIQCPATPVFGSATAVDACQGAITPTYSDQTTPGCGATYSVTRTWVATDDCGNSSSCSRTINVIDTAPPTIVCPPDIEVACGASTHPSATGYATANDLCQGSITPTYTDNAPGICGQDAGPFARVWTATDGCGNSASCTQYITCGYCGCTLTQGYWKTHSEFGPAPYDANWANLPNGASTIFYLSGQSWYDVFHTAPAGNNYYILAHQFMAAKLNYLNGASYPPQVAGIIEQAEIIFDTYTPANFNAGVPNATYLADILDQYNNGLLGVPHCGGNSAEQMLLEAMTEALHVFATPNPFAGEVQFAISMPYDSPVTLDVFNASGQKVATVFSGYMSAGQTRTIGFDASAQPQGLYIYRLTTDREVRAGQLVSMK